MLNAIFLFLLLSICVVTDLRERKIYNKILFPFLLIAFFINGFQQGFSGLLFTLVGMLAGLAILIIPYLMGGMGAGDVKMLAVIGALMDTEFVFYSAVYMAIAGGLFALFLILSRKTAKQHLKNIITSFFWRLRGIKTPLLRDKSVYEATYPYGLAIAAGAAIQFFQGGAWL